MKIFCHRTVCEEYRQKWVASQRLCTESNHQAVSFFKAFSLFVFTNHTFEYWIKHIVINQLELVLIEQRPLYYANLKKKKNFVCKFSHDLIVSVLAFLKDIFTYFLFPTIIGKFAWKIIVLYLSRPRVMAKHS